MVFTVQVSREKLHVVGMFEHTVHYVCIHYISICFTANKQFYLQLLPCMRTMHLAVVIMTTTSPIQTYRIEHFLQKSSTKLCMSLHGLRSYGLGQGLLGPQREKAKAICTMPPLWGCYSHLSLTAAHMQLQNPTLVDLLWVFLPAFLNHSLNM